MQFHIYMLMYTRYRRHLLAQAVHAHSAAHNMLTRPTGRAGRNQTPVTGRMRAAPTRRKCATAFQTGCKLTTYVRTYVHLQPSYTGRPKRERTSQLKLAEVMPPCHILPILPHKQAIIPQTSTTPTLTTPFHLLVIL